MGLMNKVDVASGLDVPIIYISAMWVSWLTWQGHAGLVWVPRDDS